MIFIFVLIWVFREVFGVYVLSCERDILIIYMLGYFVYFRYIVCYGGEFRVNFSIVNIYRKVINGVRVIGFDFMEYFV